MEENKVNTVEQTDGFSMQGTDQDVYTPIEDSKRVNWPTMLMIFVGMWVSMYSVNIGMAVGQQADVKPAIIGTILGYAIAGVFAAFIGGVGQKTGLASYVVSKAPLGSGGQILIACIMFLTIGMGSVGLQADTVARSIAATFPSIGYSPIMSGVVCAVMMISAVIGVKAMGAISWITMPLFFVVSIIATVMAVTKAGGVDALMATHHEGYSFSQIVFLNAGAWAGFVMLMPDIARFLKTRNQVFTVIPIAFVIGAIPPVCGVILGALLGQSLDTVFVSVGLSVIGLISIIGIGWTTNDNNAYTAGLALTTALYPFKKLSRRTTTIIVAIFGVVGAMFGIGNLGFITWISGFHGSFNMSFVGVLIAHYYIVSKEEGKFVQTKGFARIISWLVAGLLTYFGMLPVAVITNALLAGCLYLILYYGVEKRIWGENIVDRIVPPGTKN